MNNLSSFQKGMLICLAAFVLLGGILFVNRVWFGDAFSKEEAQHALYSAWLSKDIRALDWGNFWYDTQRQIFWPFFHSWVQSVFFLFLGPSYLTARLMSFFFFFATLFLMYVTAHRFSEEDGWKIGLLSVFLALTSPIMLQYAALNTLEGFGAFLFIFAFYVYTFCEEVELTFEYIILALLLGISVFTNYLYAYLMLPAFIVMTLGKLGPILVEVAHLSRKGEKAAYPFLWWAYRKLIVLAVIMAFVAAWFLSATFARKIMLLLQAIFRYSGGEVVSGTWQNLFFYPQTIINNFSFSPWLGGLIVLSLLAPFIASRYRWAGKLFTFCWTVIVLATFTISAKAPQFVYIIAPFLFLIFSTVIVYGYEKYKKYALAGALVMVIPALISLPTLVPLYFPHRPADNMVSALNYFKREILPRYPVAISVNLQHLNPEGVAFYFFGWNAPVLADPALGEDELLRSAKYLLTVELDANSPYQKEVLDDSISRWNIFLQEKLKSGDIREHSIARFNEIGLTARIFEKTATEIQLTGGKR